MDESDLVEIGAPNIAVKERPRIKLNFINKVAMNTKLRNEQMNNPKGNHDFINC